MAYGACISLMATRQILKLLSGSALRHQQPGVGCLRREMRRYSNLLKRSNVRSFDPRFYYRTLTHLVFAVVQFPL